MSSPGKYPGSGIIAVRTVGIAYRIPMINIIGDEGMGYYGTAFNVYNIALLLSSYSLPLAVSKMVSARLAGKQKVPGTQRESYARRSVMPPSWVPLRLR